MAFRITPQLDTLRRVLFIVVAMLLFISCGTSTANQTFTYQIRVQNQKSSSAVAQAKVTLTISGQAPLSTTTTNDGLAIYNLSPSLIGQTARVIVEKDGYQSEETFVTIRQDLPEPVLLKPAENTTGVAPTITTASPPTPAPAEAPTAAPAVEPTAAPVAEQATAAPAPQPTVTTQGGTIAFVTEQFGGENICTISSDGSNFQQLTQRENNGVPVWSPDGTKIAFYSNMHTGDGTYAIFVMNPDGTDAQQLTTATGWNGVPTWSPDGKFIAFESDRYGANRHEIFILDVANKSDKRTFRLGRSPAWSQDGTKIAYESERDGQVDIYTLNAETFEETRVTNDVDEDRAPAWSPDSSSIIFASKTSSTVLFDLYQIMADGTGKRNRLTDTSDVFADPISWSPDRTKFIFSALWKGSPDIFVMNTDGTNKVRLETGQKVNYRPSWSPR